MPILRPCKWLVAALCAAATLAPAQQPASPPPVQTPANLKARQVVQQAIAALGGEEFLHVSDHSAVGRDFPFNSSGQMDNAGTPFWAYFRYPDTERIELTKKRDVIYIYAATQGWEITYKGVAPMLSKQFKQYRDASTHSLDVILREWASDPHTLLLDRGLNTFNQAQVESVDFTDADGETVSIDFALDTHLPLRTYWRTNDPDTGGHYTESVTYGNWIKVQGVFTPFALTHYEGSQMTDQRYYTQVSFNSLPDELFVPAKLGKH